MIEFLNFKKRKYYFHNLKQNENAAGTRLIAAEINKSISFFFKKMKIKILLMDQEFIRNLGQQYLNFNFLEAIAKMTF